MLNEWDLDANLPGELGSREISICPNSAPHACGAEATIPDRPERSGIVRVRVCGIDLHF